MSRTRIKIGRYSKETQSELKEIAKQTTEKTLFNIPSLLCFSDADDTIVRCSNLFEGMREINWSKQLDDSNGLLEKMDNILTGGFFSKTDFEEVLEVTGVEMDDRKLFTTSNCKLKEITLRHWLPFVRCLPGMFELDDLTFFRNLHYHVDDFHLLNRMERICKGNTSAQDVETQIKGIDLSSKHLLNLNGPEILKIQQSLDEKLRKLNLSHEEVILIFILNLLLSRLNVGNFSKFYQRILLAFTRYLQNIHGDSYHVRYGELVNFLAFVAEQKHLSNQWRQKNRQYLSYIFDSPAANILWGGCIMDIEKHLDILSPLLNNST